MKKATLSELYTANYDCTVLSALIQRWEDVKYFDCLDDPKREDIMLYLDGYDATYTLPDGRTIEAKSGEVTYTATGSRYRVDFRRANGAETAHDDSIRFRLSMYGERIRLSGDVAVFRPSPAMIAAFRRVHALSRLVDPPQSEFKAVIYSILTEACVLGRSENESDDFALIRPAYDYVNLLRFGSVVPQGVPKSDRTFTRRVQNRTAAESGGKIACVRQYVGTGNRDCGRLRRRLVVYPQIPRDILDYPA